MYFIYSMIDGLGSPRTSRGRRTEKRPFSCDMLILRLLIRRVLEFVVVSVRSSTQDIDGDGDGDGVRIDKL